MIIFKAAPAPAGRECGHKRTVTYEIHHNVPDEWDNQYPDKSLCYVTVSKTANSSGELTLDYLKKVYFPAVGAIDGVLSEPSGLLLDAFRGHYEKSVKDYTEPMEMLDWLLMDGGITPKAQPLDVLINKVFKSFFRDLFEEWSLQAPINPITEHPLAPSRQLLTQWVVAAWEQVPEDLIKIVWEVWLQVNRGAE